MKKKIIEKKLTGDINALIGDIKHEENEKKEVTQKKPLLTQKRIDILEDGHLVTIEGEKEVQEYYANLPEDINVDYVKFNESTIFINKDYRTLRPYVLYLLGNIYESLEIRATKKNLKWIFIFMFLFVFYSIISLVYLNSIKNLVKDQKTQEKTQIQEVQKPEISEISEKLKINIETGSGKNQ